MINERISAIPHDAGHAPARGEKLRAVEATRGFAALAVVLFHANASSKLMGGTDIRLLTLGKHGVDFFFVLSGYIIFFVHAKDIGLRYPAKEYALKRFVRLVPVLWLVVISYGLVRYFLGQPLTLRQFASSIMLYPSVSQPMPVVLWTLRHEVLFYVAFFFAIINRRLGLTLFFVWTALVFVQVALVVWGRPIVGLTSFFMSSFELNFIMGAGVALLHRRIQFVSSTTPLIISILLLLSIFALEIYFDIRRGGDLDYISLPATLWTIVLGFAFSLFLHGILRAEQKIRVPEACITIGAASYSIYLIHTPINSVLQHFLIKLPHDFLVSPAVHLLLFVTGTAAGVAIYFAVERPVARIFRRYLARAKHKSVASDPPCLETVIR